MKRQISKWWSPNLQKEMEIVIHGHYGYALLMFPTAAADYLEYERFNVIDSIAEPINSGILKAFCINSINGETWLNKSITAEEKASRQQEYNNYITEEVIPFIFNNCNNAVPVVVTGASLGAFHAANSFFRRPELYRGLIALSGIYDLKLYSGGLLNDNIYFNSPVDFLSNLTDENILSSMRNKSIIISSGQGAYEDPEASKQLSDILHSKHIEHWLDLWGTDMDHDWPTWRKMLPYFLSSLNI